MKDTRTWLIFGLLILVGVGTSHASDPVPRQWTEMSLEDVGRSAFTLGSCEVTDFVNSFKRCLVPAIFADNFDLSFFVTLLWIESEPESDCERRLKICAGPRESPESFGVRSTGRVAYAGIGKPICYDALTSVGSRSRCDEDWARTQDALASQRGVVLDMLRDAVSRIELYAIPCRCGNTPIGEQADETATSRPERSVDAVESEPTGSTEATPPLSSVVTPGGDPLGQGDEAPCLEGMPCDSGSRAMRRTGGLPPDLRVVSLQFFPSVYTQPAKEDRTYSTRFGSDVNYVNAELNLRFPDRKERLELPMEVKFTLNGKPVATASTLMALEPGWTHSWYAAGYGNRKGDFWQPGRYEVEVWVKGAVVATGMFEIVASP